MNCDGRIPIELRAVGPLLVRDGLAAPDRLQRDHRVRQVRMLPRRARRTIADAAVHARIRQPFRLLADHEIVRSPG